MAPQIRLSTAVRRDRTRGRLLLAASLAVWLGTTSAVWVLSDQPIPFVCTLAALGGAFSGILGTLRSDDDPVQRTEGWIFFRVLSTFAASAVWLVVLQEVWRSQEIDARWLTFFFGVLSYTVVRDLLQTALTAARSKARARERAETKKAQLERVTALTGGIPGKATVAAVNHYASRVSLSVTSAEER